MMKSLTLKTTCHDNHVHSSLAHPRAPLGDFRQSALQIRRINNIPAGVDATTVIRLYSRTCDCTWLVDRMPRLEFDFEELGEGKILR